MSISNEQLRHVAGENNDSSTISAMAEDLRNLVPTLQQGIGRMVMDGVRGEDLQAAADRAANVLDAADLLDRLYGYCGSLDQ